MSPSAEGLEQRSCGTIIRRIKLNTTEHPASSNAFDRRTRGYLGFNQAFEKVKLAPKLRALITAAVSELKWMQRLSAKIHQLRVESTAPSLADYRATTAI